MGANHLSTGPVRQHDRAGGRGRGIALDLHRDCGARVEPAAQRRSTRTGAAMQLSYGQRISGLRVDGRELRAAVFDENEVRAAAGLTMVAGAIAFSYAYFEHQYIPLQAVASFFFLEFLIRVTVGLQYSPVGLVARAMMSRRPPEWVSAKPKRFAWSLGLAMTFAMTIITNSGIRGYLPRTICLICLTLMWMESVLGLCLGCEIHAFMVRRGWAADDPDFEVCAGGVCEIPARPAAAASSS